MWRCVSYGPDGSWKISSCASWPQPPKALDFPSPRSWRTSRPASCSGSPDCVVELKKPVTCLLQKARASATIAYAASRADGRGPANPGIVSRCGSSDIFSIKDGLWPKSNLRRTNGQIRALKFNPRAPPLATVTDDADLRFCLVALRHRDRPPRPTGSSRPGWRQCTSSPTAIVRAGQSRRFEMSVCNEGSQSTRRELP